MPTETPETLMPGDIMCDEIDLTPEDEAALEAIERERVARWEAAQAAGADESEESQDEDEDTDEETEDDEESRPDRFTWKDGDIKWV